MDDDNFPSLRKQPPFDANDKRVELLHRLNQVHPGIHIDKPVGWPTIPLALLSEDGVLDRLLDVMDWVAGEIRAAQSSPAPEAG